MRRLKQEGVEQAFLGLLPVSTDEDQAGVALADTEQSELGLVEPSFPRVESSDVLTFDIGR